MQRLHSGFEPVSPRPASSGSDAGANGVARGGAPYVLFATHSTPHPCTIGFATCPSTKRRASMAAALPQKPSLLSKLMRSPSGAEGLARRQVQHGNGAVVEGDAAQDDDPYWQSDQAGSRLAALAPAPSLPIPIPEPPRRCACNAMHHPHVGV